MNQRDNQIMMDDKPLPQRKSPRLRGYDYAQEGAYFVTICTADRAHLFGQIIDGAMVLNGAGHIARSCWTEIPDHYPNVELDFYVIMPNHVHGIIVVHDDAASSTGGRDVSRPYENADGVGAARIGQSDMPPVANQPPPRIAPPGQIASRPTIGTIVGAYKAAVTRHVNRLIHPDTVTIWQRSYHDHIIRNESSLNKIREYVLYNPARWREEPFFTDG